MYKSRPDNDYMWIVDSRSKIRMRVLNDIGKKLLENGWLLSDLSQYMIENDETYDAEYVEYDDEHENSTVSSMIAMATENIMSMTVSQESMAMATNGSKWIEVAKTEMAKLTAITESTMDDVMGTASYWKAENETVSGLLSKEMATQANNVGHVFKKSWNDLMPVSMQVPVLLIVAATLLLIVCKYFYFYTTNIISKLQKFLEAGKGNAHILFQFSQTHPTHLCKVLPLHWKNKNYYYTVKCG